MGEIAATGVYFPEGARWHEGAFWFSDIGAKKVHRLAPGRELETICEINEQPSGLGWLPDGTLLIVSMIDQRLMRLEGDTLVEHADLSGIAKHWCNDMLVDSKGHAYVSCCGAHAGEDVVPAPLMCAMPDGSSRIVAPDLMFPNGVAVSMDGARLVVAETAAHRLTRFDVADDGSLSNKTTYAELPGSWPDGICMDAYDTVWAADPLGKAVLHVLQDGTVAERIMVTDNAIPMSCTLGGENGDLLMVCVVPSLEFKSFDSAAEGWIELIKVNTKAQRF